MNTETLIEEVCKKCPYYRRKCLFDYGDSITKIPCEALRILALIRFKALIENPPSSQKERER